jgi:CubicO group peptidase (beta-lactamase class C family)
MNWSLFTVLICNATALLACESAIGQQAKPPKSFDLSRIDSYLAAQVMDKGRVGLSVAIVKNGRTVLAKTDEK